MKNLIIFYLIILVPLAFLIWLTKIEFLDGWLFMSILLIYTFVYRTYTDGKRLASKNIILEKDIWKLVIPGKRFQYFRELYLK
ncbi:hypothetical protein [Nonlabens antarcticus]|uniref:hypothetical protein n=1 Tax=Nonlabens antarcticus TaxID=392714 RepID=UPI0018913F38|nr:hypothetical protein [Nonlabens antarcticus]